MLPFLLHIIVHAPRSSATDHRVIRMSFVRTGVVAAVALQSKIIISCTSDRHTDAERALIRFTATSLPLATAEERVYIFADWYEEWYANGMTRNFYCGIPYVTLVGFIRLIIIISWRDVATSRLG